MTSTIIGSCELDDFLSENAAAIVDGYEGCLIDNYLAYSNKAVFAIYEKYATSNSSVYEVFTADIDTNDGATVENTFFEKQTAYYSDYEY